MMVKMILGVEGMMCPMCEKHVSDALSRAFSPREVRSSHEKGETVLITDAPIAEAELRRVLDPTGYRLTSVRWEPCA